MGRRVGRSAAPSNTAATPQDAAAAAAGRSSSTALRNRRGVAAVAVGLTVAVLGVAVRWSAPVHSNPTPLVSVITPTSAQRHDFHERLYRCFTSQDYALKELLVYDDALTPSPFFAALLLRPDRPANVQYVHVPSSGASVGRKRNELIARARGEVIAHFDDDDYYAPAYLSAMTKRLYDTQSDLTKLSGWYHYSRAAKFFGYWDQSADSSLLGQSAQAQGNSGGGYESGRPVSVHIQRGAAWVRELVFGVDDGTKLGYGFSYVFRRALWEAAGKFPDKNQSEDIELIRNAKRVVAGAKIDHFADAGTSPLALKFLHRMANSNVVSQYRLPLFAAVQIFGERIAPYLESAPL